MQHAILTLVLVASLAQPKLRPAAEPPRYVPIPLPDNAEQLLKSIQLDPKSLSPQMTQEIAAKLKDQFGGPDGMQKLEERVKKIVSDYIASHPQEANTNTLDLKEIRNIAEKELARDPMGINPLPQPPPDVPPPAPTPPKAQSLDQRLGKWLAEWLQNEETGGRLVEMMRDSPAFKDALDDLLRTMREVDGGWQPNLPEAPNGFEPPRLPGLEEMPKLGMPDLSDAAGWMPKMPRLEMPKFAMPQFPDLSSPSLPDLGGDWPQMLVAVLLVVGLLAATRMWMTKASAAPDRALLPVPTAIATRAELLRAFEAIAINRFGDAARPWNHRLVAHRFGGGGAIDALTRLYEQARYAPGQESLSAGDRESANRSLAQLAGGA
jgi:hypothetical protein